MVVVLGLFTGALAAWLGRDLSERTAPLVLGVLLASTMLAGRLAPIGPALAHGACGWIVLILAGFPRHGVNVGWHGIPGAVLVLVLVENMALIGRVGYVRHVMVRQREEHGA